MFNSGANLACISPGFVEELGIAVKLGPARSIASAGEAHFVVIKEIISLDFYSEDVLLGEEFLVVPDLNEEAIIGVATMQKWRIKPDFEHATVQVDEKAAQMQ